MSGHVRFKIPSFWVVIFGSWFSPIYCAGSSSLEHVRIMTKIIWVRFIGVRISDMKTFLRPMVFLTETKIRTGQLEWIDLKNTVQDHGLKRKTPKHQLENRSFGWNNPKVYGRKAKVPSDKRKGQTHMALQNFSDS